MENREIPILHKTPGLWPIFHMRSGNSFLFVGISRQTKNLSLCGLCVSVVSTNIFCSHDYLIDFAAF